MRKVVCAFPYNFCLDPHFIFFLQSTNKTDRQSVSQSVSRFKGRRLRLFWIVRQGGLGSKEIFWIASKWWVLPWFQFIHNRLGWSRDYLSFLQIQCPSSVRSDLLLISLLKAGQHPSNGQNNTVLPFWILRLEVNESVVYEYCFLNMLNRFMFQQFIWEGPLGWN